MRINKNMIGTICRIIIGLVFILSAGLKFWSIEAVDLFFFDHKLFIILGNLFEKSRQGANYHQRYVC